MKVEELRMIVSSMTPGPYGLLDLDPDGSTGALVINSPSSDMGDANASGICALRNAAPALLDLWEACERLLAIRDTEFTGSQLDVALDDIVAVLERGLP